MTDDRIAICQHPDGPGEYVPAGHVHDGRCFMDCDCTPRVYVAVDSPISGDARAAYWEEAASEYKGRTEQMHAALVRCSNLLPRVNGAQPVLADVRDALAAYEPAETR